ncbi:MAG TPA: GH25 family lysozyme [Longilinea sp.]|nr:GH25 family lysozyme [Longilinea sp.]
MILGIDVSRYQKTIDWALLKSKGVEFVVIKATSGNYLQDPKFSDHVAGANAAGLIVGAYHWCDPLVGAGSQAQYFLNAIQGKQIKFLAADMEQQWASWQEWQNRNITQLLSPTQISENGRQIVGYWRQRSQLPVVVYTRTSFITNYAQPALSWLKDYPVWLAWYPFRAGTVSVTWESFAQSYAPASDTGMRLPSGVNSWTFWQFSGDKFRLPGVDTLVDVNYYNGDLNALRQWVGLPAIPPTPTTTDPVTPTTPTTTDPTTPVTPTHTVEERLALLETQARVHGWSV